MTPAMRRALELHQPIPHTSSVPDAADILRFKMLNQFRNSLLNDSWPAKVAAFRGLFGLACPQEFGALGVPELELQEKLLDEEIDETRVWSYILIALMTGRPYDVLLHRLCEEQRDKISDPTLDVNAKVKIALTEVVDGCLDVIYIAVGFLLNLGLSPDLINLLMEEVHASNMTKVDDQGLPIVNDGIIDPSKPIGKVLKSHNYTPVDLQAVIDGTEPAHKTLDIPHHPV